MSTRERETLNAHMAGCWSCSHGAGMCMDGYNLMVKAAAKEGMECVPRSRTSLQAQPNVLQGLWAGIPIALFLWFAIFAIVGAAVYVYSRGGR